MLEFAVRKNFVAVNSARGVKVIGKHGEGSKKVKPPSKEAVRQIIAAADQDFAVENHLRCGKWPAGRQAACAPLEAY